MKLKVLLTLVTIVVLTLFAIVLYNLLSPTDVLDYTVGRLSVRDISKTEQLKVLTVRKEVLAHQHRIKSGLLKDKEEKIYVIYPAMLNFGFDLSLCDTTSIMVHGDSVMVTLPPVKILNRSGKSVDEASKRTAIEDGEWTAQEMITLRERAEALMQRNCEYDSCLHRAEELGRQSVRSMFLNMGYSHVDVKVQRSKDYGLCLIDKRFRNQHPFRFYQKDKMHYLAFNIDRAQKEARLFYTPADVSERELLALGDYFSLIFAKTPRDATLLRRGNLFFVMFRNNHLTVGSKEADKLILDAKRRNMDSLRKVISTLILKGKTVEVMEVDKDGHLIYQYPAPGR